MIEETALVSRIGTGRIWLEARPSGGCGGCVHQAGCPTSITAKLLPARELEIECDLDLAVGAEVTVTIDDKPFLLGSFLLYLVPLLVMFIGILAADTILPGTDKESGLIPVSFLSLMAGFGLAKHWQHGLSHSRLQPVIRGKV